MDKLTEEDIELLHSVRTLLYSKVDAADWYDWNRGGDVPAAEAIDAIERVIERGS